MYIYKMLSKLLRNLPIEKMLTLASTSQYLLQIVLLVICKID